MSETTITQVTVVAKNEVSADDLDRTLDRHNADSLEEVTSNMEDAVEQLLATRVFADADEIPVLDVNTEVDA